MASAGLRLMEAYAEAADDDWLNEVERRAVAYFLDQANPRNGLVRNTTEPNAPASITASGVALAVLPVGIERGWVSRPHGYQYARRLLQTLTQHLPHEHGFFYHFLDPETGARTWHSEISGIDTAIAAASALVAGAYFPDTEVEQLAQQLYDRIEWSWFLQEAGTLAWSWTPEQGLDGNPMDFSESLLAYLLGLGSSTHPLPASSWDALWRPLGRYAGHSLVFTHDGSLFAYLLPLAWIDLRDRHDAYLDYWMNATYAVLANRQFCLDQQERFATYRAGFWGLSAALGRKGYIAYGGKPGKNTHDGTVAPYAVAASIPLVPELALRTYHEMCVLASPTAWGRYGLTDSFTLDPPFRCEYYIALDQALTLLMIENFRTGFVWRLLARHPVIQRGLSRAGFQPGAQEEPTRLSVRRGNPGARLSLPHLRHPVVIDGELTEWTGAAGVMELVPTGRRNLEFGVVRSDDDVRLTAALAWDDDALFLAGTVTDDEIVTRHRGAMIYEDDCVELLLDLDHNGFRFDHNPLDAQIGFAPGGERGNQPQTWVWGPIDRAVPEVRAALRRREHGYQFEGAIPWSVIGGRPPVGRPFGCTVTLHDRDADGTSAKLVWSLDKETDPDRLLLGEVRLSP